MKVRLDVDNPRLVLRPGMFVDVEIPTRRGPALTAPADAVVDSGLRKSVYVDRGGGVFEPRVVETGWRLGDTVEITHGLEAGERVASAGTFMLDSESRMRLAAAQAAIPEQKKAAVAVHKDPVCGMEVEPDKSTPKSEYRGKTYYFCSDHCKREFDKNPAKFLDKNA
jgi:Cu(I)/Ag(I) efflux system membrane fusion protein